MLNNKIHSISFIVIYLHPSSHYISFFFPSPSLELCYSDYSPDPQVPMSTRYFSRHDMIRHDVGTFEESREGDPIVGHDQPKIAEDEKEDLSEHFIRVR